MTLAGRLGRALGAVRGDVSLAILAVGAASCSSVAEQVSPPPPSSSIVLASDPPTMPALPARSWSDRGAPRAVDTRRVADSFEAISPDSLFIAEKDPAGGILFYDVDRQMTVRRSALPAGRSVSERMRFIGDDTLVATVRASASLDEPPWTAIYDGRTGALRGEVEGDWVATLDAEKDPQIAVAVHDIHRAPVRLDIYRVTGSEKVASVSLPPEALHVLVGAPGVVVIGSKEGVAAVDLKGALLWKRDTPLRLAKVNAATGAISEMILEGTASKVMSTDLRTGRILGTVSAGKNVEESDWVFSDAEDKPAASDPTMSRPPVVLGPSYRSFGFSPDSSFAAVLTREDDLLLTDLRQGKPIRIGHVTLPQKLDFLPRVEVSRGGWLVTVDAGAETHIFHGLDPETGKVDQRGTPELSFSDHCWLVSNRAGAPHWVRCQNGGFFDVRDGQTAKPVSVPPLDRGCQMIPDFSSAPAFTATSFRPEPGSTIGGSSAIVQLHQRATAIGSVVAVVEGGPTMVVVTRNGADIWDVPSAEKRAHVTLSESIEDGPLPAVSEDGALLALSARGENTVRLFRAKDGSLARTLSLQGEAKQIAFHRGKEIFVSTRRAPTGAKNAAAPRVTAFDRDTGREIHSVPGEDFKLNEEGVRLIVTSVGDAAIYDADSFARKRAWTGQYQAVDAARDGKVVAVHELKNQVEGVDSSRNVRTTHFFEVESGRERFAVPSVGGEIAFDPQSRRAVAFSLPDRDHHLAELSRSLDLFDLETGKTSTIELDQRGSKPFFVGNGEIVGFHVETGLGFVRLSDHQRLDVRTSASKGCCSLYALEGDSFEGEGGGFLGFRLGDDLRGSEIVFSGPRFEAQRRVGLIASFFASPSGGTR